jgi:hypothetical protein
LPCRFKAARLARPSTVPQCSYIGCHHGALLTAFLTCCMQFEWWEAARRAGLSGHVFLCQGLLHAVAGDITFDCLKGSAWELAPLPGEDLQAGQQYHSRCLPVPEQGFAPSLHGWWVTALAQMRQHPVGPYSSSSGIACGWWMFTHCCCCCVCRLQVAVLLPPPCAGQPRTSTEWSWPARCLPCSQQRRQQQQQLWLALTAAQQALARHQALTYK